MEGDANGHTFSISRPENKEGEGDTDRRVGGLGAYSGEDVYLLL